MRQLSRLKDKMFGRQTFVFEMRAKEIAMLLRNWFKASMDTTNGITSVTHGRYKWSS
jgi:hypothetical protein